MLKKTLTAGATVIVAILASAGVAEASVGEVHPSQATPLTAPAQLAEPEPTPTPEPESPSDTESDATSDTESDGTSDTESDGTSDTESDGTSDTESDGTSDPESEPSPEEETAPVAPAPAPVEEEPAAGPLGLIESLLTSLFG